MTDVWFLIITIVVIVCTWALKAEIKKLQTQIADLKLEMKKIWERV